MTIEQTLLEKLRELPPEKQQEVLQFVELLQQSQIAPPTEDELAKAKDIIARGLTRAMNTPPRPPEVIWAEFEAVRSRIAAMKNV
jgi:hypothetical protein